MDNRWIRTNAGHAGRNGFIVKGTKEPGQKFAYRPYDLSDVIYGDLVGELKKIADAKE